MALRPAPTDENAWTYEILARVCDRVGADVSGARLIKFTNNAVFALPNSGLVVRIAGSAVTAGRATKVVGVARWLAEHGMPTVRLATGLPQPLKIEGYAVSLWEMVPETETVPTGHDLGRILLRFHSLPAPAMELPAWETLAVIRSRIAAGETLTEDERAFLVDAVDAVAADVESIDYVLEPGPIHGDPIIGNLIPGPNGAILCDFDGTCIGPREWDLIPAAVGQLRFGYSVDYHGQLAAAYGLDIRTWSGFPVLRRVRELQLVCSALPVLSTKPSIRDRWRHRFETLRAGDAEALWALYR